MIMKKLLSRLFLTYLRVLAQIQLFKIRPKIIGVTGSAGKTSARNAIFTIINKHFDVKCSFKANSETGLPLNILGLKINDYSWQDWLRVALLTPWQVLFNWQQYEIYLAEMAIDSPFEPKNMGYLLKIFQPDIGVFLNAMPLHSALFDELITTTDPKERSQEAARIISLEKGRMIAGLPANGTAILNADDVNVFRFKDITRANVIAFGQNEQAQVKIVSTAVSLTGTEFTFTYHGQTSTITLEQYVLPKHYAYSLAAAVGVAISLGLDFKQAVQDVKDFSLPPGRSTLLTGINNSYILDSSYNASNQPTIDAIDLLEEVSLGRKMALLGDMRELGLESPREHRLLAEKVKTVCNRVVLVGPQMKKYVLPVLEESRVTVDWVANAYQAAAILQTELNKDDMLLVKGSQNTLLLEIAVEKLMAQPEKAEQLLCRRGKYWDQRRARLKK